MQVTFTGIKNVGFIKTSFNYAKQSVINANDPSWQKIFQMEGPDFQIDEWYLLNMQLTDDFNGKHYTEFKKALKKSDLSFADFKNPINNNFLNTLFYREFYKENGKVLKDTVFSINDRDIMIEDKNLPILSFLARTIREIAQKPKEKFVVSEEYLNSDNLSKGICFGDDLKKIFGKNYYDEAKRMHEPLEVKNCAQKMDDIMHMEMMDYFNR